MAGKKELEQSIERTSVRLETEINMLAIKNTILERKFNQLMDYLNLEFSVSKPTIKKKDNK